MNKLKTLASRAKSRLLSRGLMETYSNAAKSGLTTEENLERIRQNKSPGLYLDNKKLMKMSSTERERYLLDSIRKYHQEHQSNNYNKDVV